MLFTYLALLCLISIAFMGLTAYILKREKRQITYVFLAILVSCTVCCLGYVLAIWSDIENYSNIKFSYMAFFGEFFAPVFFLLSGIIFAKGDIKIKFRHIVLFIIPIVSNFLLWTNDFHHLFFSGYNAFDDITYGLYFYTIHLIMMYGCMLCGIYYYIKFSIKNSGFFSKQAMIILGGSIVPLIFNIIWVIGNSTDNNMLKFNLDYDILPITFSIMILCYWFAIFKYDFLNVLPIALQKVVDCISDSFIIVNPKLELIDYNKSFVDKIMSGKEPIRKSKIMQVLKDMELMTLEEETYIGTVIESAVKEKRTINPEENIEKLNKIFNIEVTPIFSEKRCLGIVILFKDITELNKTQNALMEQEKLVSLGQLAGGMAHDINTPIATLRLGVKFFENRYSYTEQELKMIEAMRISADKITEIVESVRNQIRNTGQDQYEEFTISKIFDTIKVLLNNELEKNKCSLIITCEDNPVLKGDSGKLTQIIMNIVTNAIQAYSQRGGEIRIKSYKENENLVARVEDKAGGIPKKIADGIFNQILTTKGTTGTGFGLYFSQSMLKASFKGNISFETEEGVGTIFYIKIPLGGK